MDRPRRRVSFAVSLASLALVAAACGSGGASTAPNPPSAAVGGSPGSSSAVASGSPAAAPSGFDVATVYAAAQKEGRMVWQANQDLDQAQPYIDAFEKQYPGIKVDYQLVSGDVAERFIAENKAGRLSMDVYNPSIDYIRYKQENMVTDNTDALVAAGVPADTIVNGIAQDEFLVLGIAYNTNLVTADEAPKKWDDLLDPKWKGQIAVDNRLRPFIYATPFWGEARVTDFLTKFKAQDLKYRSGESASTALLLAGESKLVVGAFLGTLPTMTDKPWAFAQLDEVFSTQSDGDGPTYAPTAPHPNAAKLWINWYFGADATKIRDEIRFRGDPRPGTNTGPSKYLEEHNIAVRMAPTEIGTDQFRDLQKKYLDILGVPVN
jgi:ABC-type Fe3+ transport system substrate-binding protein